MQQMNDPLMEVRGSLLTTTNADLITGGTTYGGVEVEKIVDRIIVDQVNRNVDLKPLVRRRNLANGMAYFFNIRTDLGSTSKVSVGYAEGGKGAPYPSSKIQLGAVVVRYRSDWEVTDFMAVASASYYDAMADEMRDAFDALNIQEEKMMISGTVTGAYGIANSFLGLAELMRWHTTNGGDTEGTAAKKMTDTTAVYGRTRSASADDAVLDVSYVIAGTAGTATGVLELSHMNLGITESNKKNGKGTRRIFFCSEERGDEIDSLLQPQQRFVAGAGQLELEGGFSISTYKRIPIIRSRFMDKNGATNTGAWDSSTDADNSMYLLNLDMIEMRLMGNVDFRHLAVSGESGETNAAAGPRYEVAGGFFKTYGVFVMKHFASQVHIANLTAPATA